jgi:hypothetical protein
MPPRRCDATRRDAAAVAQQRGRRRRRPGRLRRRSGGGNGVRGRRSRTAAVTAPTAIDAPAIRIFASDASRSAGRERRMGPCASGAEHHRRRERRYPDASNAGDVVKARGGDPGRQPRGKHREEVAAFKQGKDLPRLGATHPPSTCRHPSDEPCPTWWRTVRVTATTAPTGAAVFATGDERPVTPDRPRRFVDHGTLLNRGPAAAHSS